MWHRPFGLLIDATCYNGQTEPQDDLFKKLDLLAPVELSRALARVYIYNINSTFRYLRPLTPSIGYATSLRSTLAGALRLTKNCVANVSGGCSVSLPRPAPALLTPRTLTIC